MWRSSSCFDRRAWPAPPCYAAWRGSDRDRYSTPPAYLKLSADLPLIIEVVDSEEHLEGVLPEVDRMMNGGLITMEKVRVLRYEA